MQRLAPVMRLLEERLPKAVYRCLYSLAFSGYRTTLRYAYGFRVLAGRVSDHVMGRWVFRIMPYSLVGPGGLEVTYTLARTTEENGLPGAFVELGVARGGAAALLAAVAQQHDGPPRMVWLFDSFEGLPDPTGADFVDGATGSHIRPLPRGSCLGTLAEVEWLLFTRLRFPREATHLVKGWFQDTLPLYGASIGQIALLRIDGDWYESTKCCLDHLYDQVAELGFVIIDDYESCYGCRRAVDEFLAGRGMVVSLMRDGRGGAYFVKPGRKDTPAEPTSATVRCDVN